MGAGGHPVLHLQPQRGYRPINSRVASCSADTAAVLRRARDLVEVVQPSDHLAFAVLQIQLTGIKTLTVDDFYL